MYSNADSSGPTDHSNWQNFGPVGLLRLISAGATTYLSYWSLYLALQRSCRGPTSRG